MGTIEREPEVIDNLTSTFTIDALSANQGKILNEITAKSSYVSSVSQLKSIMNLLSGIPIVLGLSGTVLDTLAGNSRGSFGFGIAVKADASTMDLMYARLGSNVIGILRYNLSTDTISKSKEYVWS